MRSPLPCRLFALVALALPATPLAGQASPARAPLDPANFGVVYDVPATTRVELRADIPYHRTPTRTLTFDLYRPTGMRRGERRPAVVFLNAIGDRGEDRVKHWGIYRTWPRLAAAHGLIGISMDADADSVQASIRALFRYLAASGAEQGVDATHLGVYAASANVSGATEYLSSDSVSQGIRAAVLYYGRVPDSTARMNLPTLLVYAASDVSWFGPELPGLARRIVERGAPWTLQFASGLPHAFDAFSDNDDARRIIQQTIAFWKSHLEPLPQPSWQPSEARAVEAAVFANDPRQSVPLLERWTANHADDAGALAMLGRGLSQLNRFPESERAYQRALALDSTDLGVVNGLAQVHLNQHRWEPALALLERARRGGMVTSLVVGQIGWAQLNLQRNAEAAASYEHAFQLGIPPGRNTAGVAWYNLACAYVRLGQLDLAFRALDRAVIEGFRDRATYEGDDDLRPLRGDPRFTALRTRLEGAQGTSPP